MRHTSVLTIALLLALAASAFAQDPPTLPLPTDPVAIGRSEFTGKWYGTVDFGGRVTSIDGDEARSQRYRDLRSGIYANNAVIGRRTADWTLEAQAWNIGYRDQRYQVDLDRVGRLRASFLYDQIPLCISARHAARSTSRRSPGVFRLEDSMQQAIQAGQATLHAYDDQAVQFDLRDDAEDRPGRRRVQRHAEHRHRAAGQEHQSRRPHSVRRARSASTTPSKCRCRSTTAPPT